MRDVSETRMGQVRYTEVMTLPSDQGYALTTLTQNRSLILFVARQGDLPDRAAQA